MHLKTTNSPQNRPTTLDRLPFGARARVLAVDALHAASRRLMEMGVVPGATVIVVRCAPLGDPLQIEIHGAHLAVRRTEAAAITVTPL